MQPSTLRIAAIQAESVPGDVEHNTVVAAEWVHRSAARAARVVVLPELFLTGYDPGCWGDPAGDVVEDDPRVVPVAAAAAETRTLVLAGASWRRAGARRPTLSLLAFGPEGSVRPAYDKQHLWDEERAVFEPGRDGSTIVVDGWRLGLGICYDGCFPEHARAAADDGALAYVCPSAYVVGSEHRRDLYYAARAIDNSTYCVMAGLVGQCGRLEFGGGTAIYDPQGRRVARVESGTGMAVADLDVATVDEARAINPIERDRPESLGGRHTMVVEPADASKEATAS